MRIISGALKGKRISAPRKLPVRPTTDMAKEGLFNILNNNFSFEDCVVLDLFAGTGNISYEFASRGSKNILAVDENRHCAKFIKETAMKLGFNIQTLKMDAFKYLEKARTKFDIIFADPPYAFSKEEFRGIVELVFDNCLLREEGLLILEHSARTDLAQLRDFDYQRKYGGSVFSFFKT